MVLIWILGCYQFLTGFIAGRRVRIVRHAPDAPDKVIQIMQDEAGEADYAGEGPNREILDLIGTCSNFMIQKAERGCLSGGRKRQDNSGYTGAPG